MEWEEVGNWDPAETATDFPAAERRQYAKT
jgi:hypothetical protein